MSHTLQFADLWVGLFWQRPTGPGGQGILDVPQLAGLPNWKKTWSDLLLLLLLLPTSSHPLHSLQSNAPDGVHIRAAKWYSSPLEDQEWRQKATDKRPWKGRPSVGKHTGVHTGVRAGGHKGKDRSLGTERERKA